MVRALFSFVSLIAIAAPANAAEVAAEAAAEVAPPEEDIIVEGQRPSYGAVEIVTATKTSTPVKNIPQAMTIITRAQIDDQQLRSVGDLLTFVPGASPATGESNRDQFTIRGNNSTADLFVNGLRDDVQYFRDFYNVERVEVLKGPNAMIFGRGGGGGIINRVTKRTSFGQRRKADIGGDSFGGIRLAGDVDQPLGSAVGLRVNALYENVDSFRRHVDLERYGINPTVGFALGADTRLDLSYEYFHDRRTADRGVPSRSDGNPATVDEPIDGFDKTFFGDPDKSFARADVHLASLSLEHDFGGGLTFRNRTMLGDYDKFYQNVYPNGAVGAAGTIALAAYNDVTRRRNLFSQTDLVWEGRLGGIDQTWLAGFELGASDGRNQRRNGVFSPTTTGPSSLVVPVSDPTVEVPVTFIANGNNTRVGTGVAALYVQGQLRPSDWLEIVAGLRYDRFSIDVTNRANGQQFERTDGLVSPRLGVVVKPTENLSLYASYGRSFLPQSGDQFNSLSPTAEALKPERFENYEVGAKWEPIDGLLATAALYQLDRTNTQARDPANPALIVLTGAQRSKGLELGLERSITHRWQISAGYAWQSAKISETTTAAPEGRTVPLVPRHSASLWTRYDVTPAFGLGFGVVARSKSYASISNSVKLPGYARLDAAISYRVSSAITAQLNLENLLGADYYPAAHNDNNIAPGAPRNAKLTLRMGI
ncbi:MAG TPA: TonB-dependent siderophore receptor [Sphingomicrobium sp.]|nr:TonB-dependent siderophore receptor [Sphingomicrobium sp.]